MFELTDRQREEVNGLNGGVIDVSDPVTNEQYVLIRKETFERIKGSLFDSDDWTAEEQLRLLAESGQRAGWNEPAMDLYDNYDENRNKLCP
jgi:hypothetical protein